jgi:hypothetical protein
MAIVGTTRHMSLVQWDHRMEQAGPHDMKAACRWVDKSVHNQSKSKARGIWPFPMSHA